jgi:hypothetical protein
MNKAGQGGDKKCEDWERSYIMLLLVAHSILVVQRIFYQGSSLEVFGYFKMAKQEFAL